MRLSTRPTASWSWLCCGLVAFAGCSQEKRLPFEAPEHFTPLPSHAPTTFASSQLQPVMKKSGATSPLSASVRLPAGAPAHFTPLPSHPPTTFQSTQLQPVVKKSGATNQIPESVQPQGLVPNPSIDWGILWIQPITNMITASAESRRKKDRLAAPIKISVIELLNCAKSSDCQSCCRAGRSRFGP
jgi:hypothetical protein